MDFIKKNLISVIAVALAVIGIPVMVFFSSGLNAANKERLEKGVSQTMGNLTGTRATYEMPVPGADGQPWSVSTEPSQLRNETMRERLERLVARSKAVQGELEERNQRGKTLLVQNDPRYGDLFPAPASESARVALLTRMMEAFPEAHKQLLDAAGVRPALEAERVRSQIEAQRTREVASITSNRVDQTLTEDEEQRVREKLGALRRDLYRAHARETAFYGTPEMFTGVRAFDPEAIEEIIPLERAWEWQHQTWFHQDLVAALTEANTNAEGTASVLGGPVKRVLSISIDPWALPAPTPAALGDDGSGGGGAGGGALNQPIAPDYSVAHDGLAGWPQRPNPLYDLRYATIQMVADGDRIPEIVSAISQTNLMNVIDLDLREYDGDADLKHGYAYGGGQAVVLTLRVDSAWLRSWMKTNMPETWRTQLGIPADPPPALDQTADVS